MEDGHGRGRSHRRIPMDFSIFNSGIAETADKPLFCLSNDEEPSENHLGINLHAGPFDVHPKIANLTHRTVVRTGWKTMRTMDVVLFETATTGDEGGGPAKVVLEQQTPPWGPLGRLLQWKSAATAVRWVFTMRIPRRRREGGRPAAEADVDFEWRHSRGLTIRRLRGADGWMLWRKRTADEARRTGVVGGGDDELVALVSRSGSRPHLGTRFAFAGAAARGELGDAFSVVALMSGIGVMLAHTRSLGDTVDALEITTRRRSMLARAAAAERQAREARSWIDTMALMDEGVWEVAAAAGEPGRPAGLAARSDRVRAWREEQQQQQRRRRRRTSEGSRDVGASHPDPSTTVRLRPPTQVLPGTPRSARTTRPLSTSTRNDALTPGRRTASNRSRLYERESERFVENPGGIHI
ncbi:hypothetical protein LX32DRAFT_698601 [Colletotrichum zoysiae]|uniref:Uncharacterized protein n=1 Tax=Colletotrichum zoysiae TaxID=1216348 RepID=A0AAD9H6L9_9PEZI|nr:hypothetical protein LX32DRAFT_698601 [Colletotrichum zoysiae]